MDIFASKRHKFSPVTPKTCAECGKEFLPAAPNQLRCGRIVTKGSCAYLYYRRNNNKYTKAHYQTPEGKQRQKAYALANKDKILAKQREYYLQNPQLFLSRCKKYREKNKDKRHVWKIIRRAREFNAEGKFSLAEWNALKALYGFSCGKCFKPEPIIKLTADHKVPLIKGGTNYIDNIQPLCGPCNYRKHTAVWFAQCQLAA